MSDAAAAIILEWFQNPDAVLLKNKHMLMAVTQQWKEYRATLVRSNLAQADVICRLSLDKLYSLLPEVKMNVQSMKSALTIANSPITVGRVLAVVQECADTYFSAYSR